MKITLKGTEDTIGIITERGKYELLEAMQNQEGKENVFPMTIEMPCDLAYLFTRYEQFPEKSLPCGCGDPEHWVVKYQLN